MAVDMTALINRALADREKTRRDFGGGSSDPAVDAFKDMWQMGQEQKAWNERKNVQRQSIMSDLSGGTSMIFNEKDLARKKERFQNYYNKYKGSMDEHTLEMGQFMLDDFDIQGEKNLDFTKQENKLESMQTNMVDALKEFDRMDASQNENYANKVKDLNEEWLDYVSDFKKTHGDRLSLKPFQHIDSQLDKGAQMNDFLLGAIRDDNYIDDAEHQAWKDSWESLSLEPISIYKQKEAASNAFVLKSASKQLVENIEEYQTLDSFMKGNITMKIDDIETSYADLVGGDSAKVAAYLRQKKQLEKEIKNLDKNYSNKLGKSYLDEMHPDLFPVEYPKMQEQILSGKKTILDVSQVKATKAPKREEIKTLGAGDKFNIPQGDLDKLKSELAKAEKRGYTGEDRSLADFIKGRAGYKKIFSEFEKAKDRDSSITFDDFISHRADLYSGWKEKEGIKKSRESKSKAKSKFRKEVGKLKDSGLKYDIMSGEGYKGDVPVAKSKKIKGKEYMFYFSSNDDGSLRIDKVLKNKYTGKYDEDMIKSSIQEWES